MILKAKERGGGRQLGLYLLRDTNEHVEVHELRGFVSDDLPSALHEVDAIGRCTKAKNYFFSVSLNPPPSEKVRTETFEAAIDAIERKMGLDGQPRAVVFHEKDGRRHAHAVWSRIDAEKMRAIHLSHYKLKLLEVSRQQFLENGWQLPPGLVNSKERDPASYSLHEWQQAKRAGHDPKALKGMFQELWARSDSGSAFTAALKSRGYTLARGDSRGHVAVDWRGEIYAIARYTGQRTKDVRSRLADVEKLPSVERAMIDHATRMTEMLRRHVRETEDRHERERASLKARLDDIKLRQQRQRDGLQKTQEARAAKEQAERSKRLSRGLRGLWDRLTGKHKKVKQQNERETELGAQRDQVEKDKLKFRQLDERQFIHRQIKQVRQTHAEQVTELHRDIAGFDQTKLRELSVSREPIKQASHEPGRNRTRKRDRGRDPGFER